MFRKTKDLTVTDGKVAVVSGKSVLFDFTASSEVHTQFMQSCYVTYEEEYGDYWSEYSSDLYAYVKNNQVMTGFIFEDFLWFSQGVAAVKKNGKWGYIDSNANLTVSYRFDYAGSFKNGMAPVRIGDDAYFIDMQGNRISGLSFEQTSEFDDINGNAWVKKDGRSLYNMGRLTNNLYQIENFNKEPEITVVYNGKKIIFDQPPITENDRTLVPLRAIFEAMGGDC